MQSPLTIHYKGVTITPGGYSAAESRLLCLLQLSTEFVVLVFKSGTSILRLVTVCCWGLQKYPPWNRKPSCENC